MISSPSRQISLLDDAALEYALELGRLFSTNSGGDYLSILVSYRNMLDKICARCSHIEEHQGMSSLLCILQEGIDIIVKDIGLFTPRRLAFLARIPGLIAEHIQFPDSKMPCSMLVRHMTSAAWTRPLTKEEESYYLNRIACYHEDVRADSGAIVFNLAVVEHQDETSDNLVMDSAPDDFIQNAESDPDPQKEISLEVFLAEPAYQGEKVITEPVFNECLNEESSAHSDKSGMEISEKTLELVSLVIEELEEVIDFYASESDSASMDMDVLRQESASLAENIGNAVELVGLEALADLCNRLVAYLKDVNQPASVEAVAVINEWPKVVLEYLRAGFDSASSQVLLSWFVNRHQLVSVSEADRDSILYRLAHPVFPEEDAQSRHEMANLQDVDLTLPEDVNPELLESLLQDLPTQTEALTHALSSMRDDRDISHVEVAQRVAHTIKGSANVVGIKGLANLSHHLEDILESLTRAQQLPSVELMNVLIEACDCVEAMSDALLGHDEPPDHALDVLQMLITWSNRINESGLDGMAAAYLPQVITSTENADQPTEVANPAPKPSSVLKENALRISADLANDLLRLAGENLIATGQIQDSIRQTLKKQTSLKNHNKLLQKLAFDLEHLIDIQGITSSLNHVSVDDSFDSLELDEYHELHTISRRLIEIAADSLALTNDLNHDLTELHNLVISHGVIQKENQELVLRTRMLPVKTIVPRLKRAIRQICRLTGKDVDLEVVDNEVFLDSEVMNEIMEPLMHLLRNAVDHGIEAFEHRLAMGKPARGLVHITFLRIGDSVEISVRDDGQGMAADLIYNKAVEAGLIPAGTQLTQEETYRLVLQHGFTTRDQATQVSGRGVGLDVVSVKIRELKGLLDIESMAGQGCTFRLNLPISSFSTHSLLVRIRKYVYAISTRGIEEIMYPDSGRLIETDQGLFFATDTQSYNAVYIENLFNLGEDHRSVERNFRPVLIVKDELGGRRAILVQDVLDSHHVVVKPLGMYLPRMAGIAGSTILGDGSIAPVIDLPELLLRSMQQGDSCPVRKINTDQSPASRRYILVVDDSLSSRRSLVQFVRDMGYEAREARDGMEAVSMIEQHMPGLVLVDMEMPRMNGLELTAHIRGNENISGIPVVMITSRSSEKHRAAALAKGVNYFMVKPFAEDKLAEQIHAIFNC